MNGWYLTGSVLGLFIISYGLSLIEISSVLAGVLAMLIPADVFEFVSKHSYNRSPKLAMAFIYRAFILKFIIAIVFLISMLSLFSLNGLIFCFAFVFAQICRICRIVWLNKVAYKR